MNKTTLLIVDDDPVLLATMGHILSPLYKLRAANSGERALIVAATKPYPDLILLDVLMPDMDGFTVLSKLKENAITRDIPVIFVTVMGTFKDEANGLDLGVVDYISKPIESTVLLARIKNQLIVKQAYDFLNNKNSYLETEVARRMAENQMIQEVSIRALAHLAEIRDPETGDHILRTQSYIQVLAKKLQGHPKFCETITDQFIDLLTRSAPLHDIGKVGIPDHILLKPGKLTEQEWTIMKTHAELGSRAIVSAERDVKQSVEFLTQAKEVAHWHHERWDGSGYPDGLCGCDIPTSARLMTVADVFDALISQRVYKPAYTFEKAKDIIIAVRGRQFDPDITDAFLSTFDDFVAIAQKYKSDS